VTGQLFVGIDLGTSGMKAVVLDESGEERCRAARSYGTRRPEPGAAEQSPADWLSALGEVLVEVAGNTSSDRCRIRTLSFTGMIPTLVTLDRANAPNGPAVTWEDARAEPFGALLRDRVGADRWYEITGQWLDGRYLLPMLLRLSAIDAARVAGTAAICSAKDYLVLHLTGELATDPSTAAGSGCFGLRGNDYDESLLGAAAACMGGPLPALPAVMPPTTLLPMRPEVASDLGLGDVTVCLGAADSVLGALGMGVHGPDELAYLWGTSTVLLTLTDVPRRDPAHRFLVTPSAVEGLWGLEMDLVSTGSAVSWAAGAFVGGSSEAEFVELAAGVDPAGAPVFLPYLGPGEQGALWDPSLAGTVLGLERRHGAAHLARGLLNGILLEGRRAVDVLRSAGCGVQVLHGAGGPLRNPVFRQDLADVTGCRVVATTGSSTSAAARGAALLGASAVGAPLRPGRRTEEPASPSPSGPERWAELWVRHEAARKAVTAFYRAPRWRAGAGAGAAAADPAGAVPPAEGGGEHAR
jgi:xylulokinase